MSQEPKAEDDLLSRYKDSVLQYSKAVTNLINCSLTETPAENVESCNMEADKRRELCASLRRELKGRGSPNA